jgi:hypothetical protein
MNRFPPVRLLIASLLALALLFPTFLSATAQDASGTSASNPVPLDSIGEVGDYEISIIDIMPDAEDYILAYSEFNEPAAEGVQFFLVRVQVTYVGETSGSFWQEMSFEATTGTGAEEDLVYTEWDHSCGDYPESGGYSTNELFPGGTSEFNVCWAVDDVDVTSLAMTVSTYAGGSGEQVVWFSLGNAPLATPVAGTGLKTTTETLASSRTEPLPIGTASLVGTYVIEVIAVEADATDLIVTNDSFNDPPATGNQFYMVTVSVTNEGEETVTPWWDLQFEAVGDQAIGYNEGTNSCGYIPNGAYDAPEIAPGESTEFNVCWQVPSDEADSLVMYVDTGYSNEFRTWFTIQP